MTIDEMVAKLNQIGHVSYNIRPDESKYMSLEGVDIAANGMLHCCWVNHVDSYADGVRRLWALVKDKTLKCGDIYFKLKSEPTWVGSRSESLVSSCR